MNHFNESGLVAMKGVEILNGSCLGSSWSQEIIKLPEDNFLYDFTYKGSILTSVCSC